MEVSILNLLIVLFLAWLFGSLVNRFGYPSILGELAAGIIFGPPLLGLISMDGGLESLAQIGVLLMMLYIGMEIDYRELSKASWAGLLASIGGFIVPFGLGYLIMTANGYSPATGLFVAIAVGVTSLATKSRILVDLKLLDTRVAHVLMAGALLSDTMALLVFAVILGIAENGAFEYNQLAFVGLKAGLFFAFAILTGLYALPFIGKKINASRFKSRTLNFTFMLLTALLFAEAAELAGMHGILGTFMAGLFLKDSIPDKKLFQGLSANLYDVSIGFLAPIFFVTAGFNVTLDVFTMNPGLLIVIIVAATVGKIVGTMVFYLPSGYGWREGFAIGTGMNGRGAVEIIIAGIGLQLGFITEEVFSILVFMAIFTTATVPFLLTWSVNWLKKRGLLVRSAEQRKGVVIVGAGALSRFAAKKLAETQPVWLIDNNIGQCVRAKQEGLAAIHGNALKLETLSAANAAKARTFIGFTQNSEINILAAQIAKENFFIPDAHVLITPSAVGAHGNLLEPIQLSSLFAKKIELSFWDQAVENETFDFRVDEATVSQSPKQYFNELIEKHGAVLPLLIVNSEGTGVFHFSAQINPGDKIWYLFTSETPPAPVRN